MSNGTVATLAASVALALAGCATPVLQSTVEVPAQFAAVTASEQEPEVAWWESFGDPVLSQLVRRAATENRDIRMASERVRAARAGETISRSWMMPNIGATAAGIDHDSAYGSRARQAAPDAEAGVAGINVSWEVDLSGRLRAGAAAASAEALAAEHDARGVRLLVLSDVASNYFTLVGALRQLETVRAISAAQDETLRLVTARQRAGLATPFDVERARTDAFRARAAIPPLETAVAVSRHRIAVLIGDQASNAAGLVPWDGQVVVPSARPDSPRPCCNEGRTFLHWRHTEGGERAPATGCRGVVPAPVSRRAVRQPERRAEQFRPGLGAIHERGAVC